MSTTPAPADADLKSRQDRMAEVSKLLAAGLTAVSAIFAVVGVRDGGTGRILSNAPELFILAVALVAVSVILALASLIFLTRSTARSTMAGWFILVVVSLLAFTGSAAAILGAANASASKFERPGLSVKVVDATVSIIATLPLLEATETLTVVVAGFNDATTQSPTQSALTGDTLLRSTTGPAADGTARIESTTPIPSRDYKVIEVRAYRNSSDPGCLVTINPDKPAACVQVYLIPIAGS